MSRNLSVVPALAVLLVACGGQAPPPGGPPAMPVEIVALAPRAVEQTTEFVGTVLSRRSTAVQPQVEGFLTRILVRSGQRVEAGAPLMEVDPRRQAATVASLESQRASREAELQLARQDAARVAKLHAAGAASLAQKEQADTAQRTAEARLAAADAQLAEQRVELGYHTVTSPVAGVVGDIPLRVGDSVTKSTVLTTLDQAGGLEVYVNVPVQQAARLRTGLVVHLVDDAGHDLVSTRISFVSPSVEADTQSVLVKAPLEAGQGFRTGQFVRARIVWSAEPSLTVPLLAVSRVGGQHFAFVAVDEDGKTLARQRQVTVGAVVGNDYVLESGLQAGERLIVAGIQKIGDGSPVQVKLAGDGTRGE
ncbi:MAG: efflux RND transporter periplasmic adaptor subunit [Vicinamibacteria bacterium]|nr:efflux RND transporter periplasmic adaptor subunit [Vicinamibacteria bacterium]